MLPAYWATLLLVVVLGRPDGLSTVTDWLWQLLLIQNYEANRFVLGLTQVWSLGTEVAFYLVLPLAAAGIARIARGSVQRRLRTAVVVLAVVSALSLLWPLAYQPGNALGLDQFVAPLWLPQYLGWFAGGMVLALLDTVSDRAPRAPRPRRGRPRAVGLLGGRRRGAALDGHARRRAGAAGVEVAAGGAGPHRRVRPGRRAARAAGRGGALDSAAGARGGAVAAR